MVSNKECEDYMAQVETQLDKLDDGNCDQMFSNWATIKR